MEAITAHIFGSYSELENKAQWKKHVLPLLFHFLYMSIYILCVMRAMKAMKVIKVMKAIMCYIF